MTDHFEQFPFEEIRDPNGDYYASAPAAVAAGHRLSQVWSVVESDGSYTYGPPYHYVNVIGFIATEEHHDNDTYYHEDLDE